MAALRGPSIKIGGANERELNGRGGLSLSLSLSFPGTGRIPEFGLFLLVVQQSSMICEQAVQQPEKGQIQGFGRSLLFSLLPSARDSESRLYVDLQFPVQEGALAELDGLAPPLGLGGVRVGGGLAPEDASEGRRHRQAAAAPPQLLLPSESESSSDRGNSAKTV